ncbi:MAG: Ig-like domain-containing protein [Pseudomonadota bacterium]
MISMPSFFAGKKVNPAVLQAALSRFFMRKAPARNLERPPQRRKILFESLEPRLLMSADFNPVAPMGTLIHQSSQAGNLATADAAVSYTLALDAGQKISVVFDTADLDLRGSVELYDTDGTTLLASAEAGNAGEMALLDSVVAANAGDYRLDVRNLNVAGDGGDFTAEIFLNAAVEGEAVGGTGNNDLAHAQDLAASEIALSGGGLRYAAVGNVQVGEADYYALNLALDETLSIGLAAMQAGTGNALHLELRDAADALIAIGDATPSNFDQLILNFKAPAAGAYYLRVSGGGGEDYTLVAVKSALLEAESNSQPAQAQDIGTMTEVLGGVGGSGVAGSLNVAVVSTGSGGGYDAGLLAIVSQLNDDTWFDFNATLVAPTGVDTLAELSAYDAVVIGGSGNFSNQFATFAPVLRAYVEGGGGLVTTGWGVYASGGLSGQTDIDFDAVVPVSTAGYSYFGSGTVTPTGTHAIVAGVSAFSTGVYIEFPSSGKDTDASALAMVGSTTVAAVKDLGLGHSAYLGPIYSGSDGYNTSDLRTGAADRLLEQAVAWVANGGVDTVDNYLVSANEGDALVIGTTTYADGVNEPDNNLDPLIELFNPAGTLVASNDNGASDGRNALLNYTVQAGEAGQFRIRISAVSGGGDYSLDIQGATGDMSSPLAVLANSLADGVAMTASPGSIDFTFSEAIDLGSVQAGDLVIDGPNGPAPANAVQVVDDHTLRFDFSGLAGADGHYTLTLSGISDLQGEALSAAHVQGFVVDSTGPSIVDVSPAFSAEPGDVVIAFTLDEGLDTGWLSTSAIELREQLSGQYFYAYDVYYDADLRRASFAFQGLPEGNYDVSLLSYYIRDALGNTLNNGSDHLGNLIIDNALGLAYPTPLAAKSPVGSLIYDPDASGAFSATGDVDDYSLELDAGQTLSVGMLPVDNTYMGRIEVFDPLMNSLGAYEGGYGDWAVLNTLPANEAGTYLIRVSSLDGAGRYTLKVLLNAAAEEEMFGWSGNDGLASAQSLDASVIPLDGGSSRAAVSGTLEGASFSIAQPMLLGTLGRGGTLATLVELDPGSGAVIRTIGAVGYSINGLEYDATRGILYGTVSDSDPDSSARGGLVRIDLDTGAGTFIGNAGVGTLVNVTSDSAGNLFAWAQSSNDLVQLDPDTGAGVVIGDSGLSTYTHGLAFDANDNLYFVNGGGGVLSGRSRDRGRDVSVRPGPDRPPR